MASNRKRSSVSRFVGGLLRGISADVEMHQDPLGSTYQVNKFGWIVTHNSFEELKKVHAELLLKLSLDDDKQIDGVYVAIDAPYDLDYFGCPGQGRLNISFH